MNCPPVGSLSAYCVALQQGHQALGVSHYVHCHQYSTLICGRCGDLASDPLGIKSCLQLPWHLRGQRHGPAEIGGEQLQRPQQPLHPPLPSSDWHALSQSSAAGSSSPTQPLQVCGSFSVGQAVPQSLSDVIDIRTSFS